MSKKDKGFRYENRFFLTENKQDTSHLACSVELVVVETSVDLTADFSISDGYNRINFSDFHWDGSLREGKRYKFVHTLLAIRDACDTMIQKVEEADELFEKIVSKKRD